MGIGEKVGHMKKVFINIAVLLALFNPIALTIALEDPEPSLAKGAYVYKQRCALCHGNLGLGDGLLPSKIKNYPGTNLLDKPKTTAHIEVYKVITHGGTLPGISEFMPPMGDDLTWTETESVVSFVMLLRENPKKAEEILIALGKPDTRDYKEGMEIFLTRCALCHGETGEGNGRLAKIINSPPPFDLTSSRKPDEYLETMITNGGEFMGRSKQMPAWGDQLTPSQIKSVINYIKTIRD